MASNYFTRIVPDVEKLIPGESAEMAKGTHRSDSHDVDTVINVSQAQSSNGVSSYEDSDLPAIMRSQMLEDLIAYRYDLDFCTTQLNTQRDLTPQEMRTLQIRILDCGHNIRHCKHRIQTLDAQAQLGAVPYPSYTSNSVAVAAGAGAANGAGATNSRASGAGYGAGKNKRPRLSRKSTDGNRNAHVKENSAKSAVRDGDMDVDGEAAADEEEAEAEAQSDADNSAIVAARPDAPSVTSASPSTPSQHMLQRLGYWDCRLCRSRKFLEAGQNRVPSAPCKWPLRDISKLINHFLDLHTEHTPQERCSELGDALARNRGPFEYWLTRTKSQDIEDAKEVIGEYIAKLQSGDLPDGLRSLQRAAALFPNSVSHSYTKKG
ncbi:hypothetical protein F5Y17DRAFT_414705 [Xylariaceae sp. FL0594]|nr:hypothetical protein F5Y17DRAFT_414705 [Xylariaceae sp. FL0594]